MPAGFNSGFQGGNASFQQLEKVKASRMYFWVFVPGVGVDWANGRGLTAEEGTVTLPRGGPHRGVWVGTAPFEQEREYEVVTKVKARSLEEARAKVQVR